MSHMFMSEELREKSKYYIVRLNSQVSDEMNKALAEDGIYGLNCDYGQLVTENASYFIPHEHIHNANLAAWIRAYENVVKENGLWLNPNCLGDLWLGEVGDSEGWNIYSDTYINLTVVGCMIDEEEDKYVA